MTGTITIAPRFCGPPGMGNGGYVAGRLADHLDGQAEVTLRRGTPLGRPLTVLPDGDGVRLLDGGSVIAEARPAAPVLCDARPAAHAEAVLAATAPVVPEALHPLPHCFVCGPARAPGDGLFIYPGPLAGAALPTLAAPWIPERDLAAADGLVAPAFVWAALDCPGGFAVLWGAAEGAVLLGRLAVTIERRPAVGEPCAVTAWASGREGRKLYAGSALFGSDGAPIARGRAVWILVDPSKLHAGAG
ncbi:MAG: hypothetical protein ACK4QW_06720 [Alphaproteobacteria bacterium]